MYFNTPEYATLISNPEICRFLLASTEYLLKKHEYIKKSVINTSQNQSLIHKQSVINSLKNQSLIHFRYSAVPLLVQHQHASTAINGKTAINYLL